MCIGCPGNSVFGDTSQFIKIQNGDFVAIKGVNTMERLIAGDIRIPYKQILKSRIILKAGQVNYLLNHLGLGDNATFLAIKATYNATSVNRDDNYVNWNYYDDFSNIYALSELMVLTGNPTNRIKQIYLTNPNTKYPVVLDVMVAIIDDEYSFFNDFINQTGSSFTGLSYTDIHTHVINESIVILDSNLRPLVYITLANLNSIQRSDDILILDDDTLGSLFLQFLTEYDALQAYSILNYVLENPGTDIAYLSADNDDPVVFFYSKLNDNVSGWTISVSGTTSIPTNTSMGYTFSTSIDLSTYGTSNIITKEDLLDLLIDYVYDSRDGTMSMTSSNIILTGTTGSSVSSITEVGSYIMEFDFSDIAQNYLDGVIINLDIL